MIQVFLSQELTCHFKDYVRPLVPALCVGSELDNKLGFFFFCLVLLMYRLPTYCVHMVEEGWGALWGPESSFTSKVGKFVRGAFADLTCVQGSEC